MSNSSPNDKAAMVIPAFGKTPSISLEMNATREAEMRFIEAKTVNPVTYVDLEHTFNESYRELKRHHATVGYQVAMAKKAIEEAKANVLLDKYPDFIKDKPKNFDNADVRKAFFARDDAYNKAMDRLAQLEAIQSFIDGRIKVLENVCRYMRKEMDLVNHSGLGNKDLYNTQGRK